MQPPLTPDQILAHPRFREARAAHVDAVISLFKSNRFVTRMMVDAGVIILRGFLVGFHVIFNPEDPSTWATPSNVRQALVTRGLASARRVDDLLAHFRQAGHFFITAPPGDRRVSLLVPAARVIAHDREHLAAYHRFLLDLYPGRGYEWVLTLDEEAHRAFRRAGMHDQRSALSVLQHGALLLFLARDAGYLALLLVLQAELAGGDEPTWTSMASDLGVSRSHLKRLFSEAATAGYVRLPADPKSRIEVQPALLSAFDRFLAGIEADQDAIARVAFGTPPICARSTQR